MFFNLLDGVVSLPLILSAIAIFALIVFLAFLLDNKKGKLDTHSIAFAGISIALSIGLSFIRLFSLLNGGDITLASTLPFLLFAFSFGPKMGVLCGFILGLITFAINPYAVHPAQVLLDYPIAFSAMGLVGVFNKVKPISKLPIIEFTMGSVFACCIRFIAHVLAGVFAYETPLWGSIVYNSFVFIDIAISVVVGIIILSSSKPLLKLIVDMKNKKD